jgi:two-component system CheB/CheR fusion protein
VHSASPVAESSSAPADPERRFRALIEHSWDAVALFGGEGGVILYASPSTTRILGYSTEALQGHSLWEFVHPDDLAPMRADARHLLGQPGASLITEYRYRHRDGSYRWLEGTTTNLLDDPSVGALVANFRDTTERREAHAILSRSEALHRALVSNFPNGFVLLFDGAFRHIIAGGSGLALLGLTAEDLSGRTPWEALPPGMGQVFAPLYHVVMEGREGEAEFFFEDRAYALRATPVRNDAGDITAGLLIAHDLTERKRVEAGLASVLTHAPCILFYAEVVERGEKLLWDIRIFDEEGAQRVLSLDVRPDQDYVHAWWESRNREDNARMRIVTAASLAAGENAYAQEYRCTNRYGEEQWLSERVHLQPQAPGHWRAVGVCTDVTERKRLEATLREQARALEEANARKDEFLAMLAHELRNPLAPMLNAVAIMRSRADRERGEHARDVIERQVHHMARLVDDLLDVARITRGTVELRRRATLLATVVGHAVETGRPFIAARNHTLTIRLPDEAVPLYVDPTRIAQVITNLLTNAAKFTEPGGRIEIVGELDALPEGARWAVLRVRDTGKGIPPDMLPHIFDVFTQVDPGIDRSEGGLGLGLTLVRTLTEMHGGAVEARSAGVGEGSEFLIRLPVFQGEASQTSSSPLEAMPQPREVSSAGAPASTRRVLIVEDNPDAAETCEELLQDWGYQTRVAHSGPVALQAAAGFLPDVVLMDIGLPGMDGYEVARRLRDRPGGAGAVLIALTGYGQDEDRRLSRESGFHHHLVKPVDPENLRLLLASLTAVGSSYG